MYWIEIYSASETLLEKVPALAGQRLNEILQRQGISFPQSCQGLGTCKQCKVTILTKSPSSKKEVLACQYRVYSSLKVILPYLPKLQHFRTRSRHPKLKTPVRTISISLPRKPVPGGLTAYLPKQTRKKFKHTPHFCRTLPADYYKNEKLTIQTTSRHFWNGDKRQFIILCDFGTTTVSCRKVAVRSGSQESYNFANPQIALGSDVISRIHTLMDSHPFQKCLEDTNHFISQMLESMNTHPREVFCFIVTGNSVMEYILRGFSPHSLGSYPFLLSWQGDEWTVKQDMLWYFFPLITGFLGGDLLAGLYGIHADKEKDFLFIDIGTNGEIALSHKDTIYSCSCAAGPALEGGNIENGGPAVPGAVYCLKKGEFQTIGNIPPHSFCGSGIIDFIWSAYQEGILHADGTIQASSSDHFLVSDNLVIHKKLPSLPISQKEIRDFQNAKAAFWSGIKILLEESGRTQKIPRKIYVGGGFSHSLNVTALQDLDFFPQEVFKSTIIPSPQPAMEGLMRFYELLNRSPEKTLQRIFKVIKPLSLAEHQNFEQYFMQGIFLDTGKHVP